jgi:uncharacterized damage-inducible protein DinB
MSTNVLVTVLEEGRQDVVVSVDGLSDDDAAAKPTPGKWSALDCLEHLVIVEERFLGWLANGSVIDQPEPNTEKEGRLGELVTDRSHKAQAPEAAVPTGRYLTLATALADFNRARDLSIRIAQERGEALYTVGVKHPRFGDMNGVELLHVMSGHGRRHAAQIRELRTAE